MLNSLHTGEMTMVKLELYIREITRFLRTVTLKNKYFADQMLETWVKPNYRESLSLSDHPYYRHLSGNYILSSNGFEALREQLGIPTSERCAEIYEILHNTRKHLPSDYAKATQDLEACRELLGLPALAASSLDLGIRNYLKTTYGLTDYVYVDGVRKRTNDVYAKFDEVPIVQSFDTMKKIPFVSLAINSTAHRKTKAVYKIPSLYYDKLIAKYSNEKDVIKCILYPIESIDVAYNAENYEILACDLTQLESAERTSLYNAMVSKLNVIRRRWDVSAFIYENLYALSMQAKIWSVLMAELFKQRIQNIRTSEVHSFHIWNYLASHGVGDFSDILTRKQTIFLYKNWPWLLRHRGSDHNLILLADKLLKEHHLSVDDKTLLQHTTTLADECKSTPVVITNPIQNEIMSRLNNIDSSDHEYLNKTIKARDELLAFNYTVSDSMQAGSGQEEDLSDTYANERKAGLEYDEDENYATSIANQTKRFTYAPYTDIPTKLLDLQKANVGDYFANMYIRFVTESILYNLSIGDYGDDTRVLEYSEQKLSLSIKELLVLFFYCEAQVHAVNETVEDLCIPTKAYLTVPYKKPFNKKSADNYHWYGIERYRPYTLNIIPDTLTIASEPLPLYMQGEFALVNPTDDKTSWIWKNSEGSVLRFDVADSGGRWALSSADSIVLYSPVSIPYWNWTHWDPTFYYAEGGTINSSTIVDITVSTFHYVIDDMMPSYNTRFYYNEEFPEDSLIHLINNQATNYVTIFKEHLCSSWSRQHASVLEIIDDRTFKGVVSLNLSPYETFGEHISNSLEIESIVKLFVDLDDETKKSEYSYLADKIVKLLYPIDSSYLINSELTMFSATSRIKDLVVDLCSYNVAWLDSAIETDIVSSDCIGVTTVDFAKVEYGLQHITKITETKSSVSFSMGFDDKWCYDAIIRYKYKADPDVSNIIEITNTWEHIPEDDSWKRIPMDPPYEMTVAPITLISEIEKHDCPDHQYVMNSDIETYLGTQIAAIDPGDNIGSLGYEIVTFFSDLVFDSTNTTVLQMNNQ